ncbi:DNA polymerase III subunit gamma/tau, partial [Leptospira bourretii]
PNLDPEIKLTSEPKSTAPIQEEAVKTKPAATTPSNPEDMEKLLKEKFSGMEVDPNQFKNL